MSVSYDRLKNGFMSKQEKDLNFEEFWSKSGELLATMAKGNIKQFAKDVWSSAIKEYGELYLQARYKAHLKEDRCSKCSRPFLHYLEKEC